MNLPRFLSGLGCGLPCPSVGEFRLSAINLVFHLKLLPEAAVFISQGVALPLSYVGIFLTF